MLVALVSPQPSTINPHPHPSTLNRSRTPCRQTRTPRQQPGSLTQGTPVPLDRPRTAACAAGAASYNIHSAAYDQLRSKPYSSETGEYLACFNDDRVLIRRLLLSQLCQCTGNPAGCFVTLHPQPSTLHPKPERGPECRSTASCRMRSTTRVLYCSSQVPYPCA